ncbi:beta-N-acetylhexosaminidase [uncultured Alistipes sp.]|uniref:beta-N-acetylhexosaminidase n=2 Tax=uncultured Alistipes sp. TaxID=538949 RepID=UPI00261E279F|nr:beta-N-acetylhexosaminidase [uncultured Alistipes sp.]
MKKLLLAIAVLHTVCVAASSRQLHIIPQPVRAELREGVFAAPGCRITAKGFPSQPGDLLRLASELAAPREKGSSRRGASTLLLRLDTTAGIPREGYRIRVTPHSAQLTAGDESGIFYGLQTLLQAADANGNIPCCEIDDHPRYGYRGLHLDVCRHFFPVEFVKRYLDRMASLKLNTFHWHLTDDQGWRIEIKRYPRLTEVGAWRDKTQIGGYDEKPATFEFEKYGGFYTQDQIREVVAYAEKLHITVIPEIEMPGHALAALTAYPELGCVNGPESYEIGGWISGPSNVFCPGKEHTFEFLENVLDEVIALFPSKLIHIGGDECQRTRWEACPDCQARIAAEGLQDETQLQSYLTHRIDRFLAARGRQLIGWDEIMDGGLSPEAVVMSWRGTAGGIAAARQKHHVIMTPGQYLYFDKKGSDSPEEPVSLNLALPLEQTYGYDPAEGLSEEEQQYLLGVQANVWTEFVPTGRRVEYQLLPRIYALAEIAWTPEARKSWQEFSEERLPAFLARLDAEGTPYRVPAPRGMREESLEGGRFTFTIRPPFPGCRVFYTLNGATPYDFDREMPDEFRLVVPEGEQRVLKCVAVTPSGRRSIVVTTRLSNPRK